MSTIDARERPFERSATSLWTVGHSTRSFDAFIELLTEHRIKSLVDVRHYPESRRVPWATKENLAIALPERGVAYEHIVDLGGYRKPVDGSGNQGWRNAGFRGYADHMSSPEFILALDRLVEKAKDTRTAIMCAEAVPWKCHRSLLSDSLLVRGVRVFHVVHAGPAKEHRLTPFAKVHGNQVTYPARQKGV